MRLKKNENNNKQDYRMPYTEVVSKYFMQIHSCRKKVLDENQTKYNVYCKSLNVYIEFGENYFLEVTEF